MYRRTLAFAGAAVFLVVWVALATGPARASGGVDWPQYGFDAERTSYNPLETSLGVGNAGSLHSLWSVDLGDVMIAQPVLTSGVDVGGTLKDLIYIGTEHGDMYALDASN